MKLHSLVKLFGFVVLGVCAWGVAVLMGRDEETEYMVNEFESMWANQAHADYISGDGDSAPSAEGDCGPDPGSPSPDPCGPAPSPPG